jgi:AraC family transcriptional regulator, regulatory protein of adaptative response / methylated-DNA-[protein]-cysteine methyltransferase
METESPAQEQIYYQALLRRDTEYEGVFYVGVKTTGIFCHATCPARKPKFENCVFFDTAQQALDAGFRPCKRCQPLSNPHCVHDRVEVLVAAVEANPERKWRDADFREYFTDASTARRQFRQHFGMTFVEYVRSRRIALAVQQLQAGASVIDAQIASGYESGSGFREAFARVVGSAPKLAEDSKVLYSYRIDTRLGPMVAIASDELLYLLEFSDRAILSREIEALKTKTEAVIVPGCPEPIRQIEAELRAYFEGTLTTFRTPIAFSGTAFQQRVWCELQKIPYGETRAYAVLATAVGNPAAVRAVAQANGANSLAIIVPCHRVINTNGKLGGYGGGLSRKQWLLQHERR